jgi:hypothetical protein
MPLIAEGSASSGWLGAFMVRIPVDSRGIHPATHRDIAGDVEAGET